ncbi:MAG: GNAT family N-acyltransferase [Pseudomonadota bacterium]
MHGQPAGAADTYIDVSATAAEWRFGAHLPTWAARWLARLTGIEGLVRLRRAMPLTATPAQFAATALQKLAIQIQHDPAELDSVPRTGRLIFIANHPFGALDGLIAIALLGALRPDLKIFANEDLCALHELRPMLLPIEVLGKKRATCNAQAMRNALRWLESDGALMLFPAGEVSHFDVRARCVTDPPWSRAVALLARKARAQVVPVHFTGENGLPFQIAGFLHPRLRTLMLPGELNRRGGSSVPVRVGAPLPSERLRGFDSDEALAAHLRVTTYLLARRPVVETPVRSVESRRVHPLALSGAPADLAAEIARLPPSHRLLEAGDHAVYCAEAEAIPHLLDEIGRLRELTFRAVGEGTGHARDLDAFDGYYEHLFIWNRKREEVIGAYRVGRIDEIRRRAGRRGLYTASLFNYRDPFFQLLGPALEMGRSFVRPEAQRTFAPLLLLWKGIGEYLAQHPRYLRLLGPVSISNDYRELSRQLLVEFLRSHCLDPLLAHLVRPVHPVTRGRMVQTLAAEVSMLGHLDALAALVEDIEPDHKGVPVLLRQYLKLGGRMLAFNVDPAFNHSIDCLLMVDLRQTDPRVLRKYLPEHAVARVASRSARFPGLRKAS